MTERVPAEPSALTADAVADGARDGRPHRPDRRRGRRRLAASGPNELEAEPPESLPRLIFGAVTEPFVLLLLVAGIVAVALGEVRDGLLVLLGLVPIVGADVVVEYRAERALDELRAAAAPVARVRRDGVAVDLPARELVAGRRRPGPGRRRRAGRPAATASAGLAVDRSVLTGESVPEGAATAPDPPGAPLAERRSMAFAGTSVVRGAGEGIVVATGPATETGRIAATLGAEDRRRSPLQRELDRLVRILLVVAVGLIVITVGSGFPRGNPAGENILAGISAAIAAIPEEPPILLAVVLGFGAHRLLRRGVLVRRLSAEETLGAVGLILTDKTGTLTQNRLALADVLRARRAGAAPAPDSVAVLGEALRAEEDAWRAAGSGAVPGSFSLAIAAAIEDGWRRRDARPVRPRPGRAADRGLSGRPGGWRAADGRTVESALGAPEAVLALARRPRRRSGIAWRRARIATRGRRRDGGCCCSPRRRIGDGASDGAVATSAAVLAFADPIRDGVREALRTGDRGRDPDRRRHRRPPGDDRGDRGRCRSRGGADRHRQRARRPGTTTASTRSCRRSTASRGRSPSRSSGSSTRRSGSAGPSP